MKPTIVVVEDDLDICRLVQHHLEAAGFSVRAYNSGSTVISDAERQRPGMFILDIMVPGRDGLELCRYIRQTPSLSTIPVIFLTAKSAEADRVLGLELGADDYVVKPFAFSELLARVRSILRRTPSGSEELRIQDLEIDTRHHRATRHGVRLNLTPKEFLLLTHLARSVGEVVSRAEIAEHVWDIDFNTDTNVVDVVVRRLRAKVDDPFKKKLVHTIRGVGYVLKAD